MPVTLQRLEGEKIPVEHRSEGVDAVFRVTGSDGQEQFYTSEIEAARVATELSGKEAEE